MPGTYDTTVSPARASLLTGQNTARNHLWHVLPRYCYPNACMQEPAYPEDLLRAACTTGEALKDDFY